MSNGIEALATTSKRPTGRGRERKGGKKKKGGACLRRVENPCPALHPLGKLVLMLPTCFIGFNRACLAVSSSVPRQLALCSCFTPMSSFASSSVVHYCGSSYYAMSCDYLMCENGIDVAALIRARGPQSSSQLRLAPGPGVEMVAPQPDAHRRPSNGSRHVAPDPGSWYR